MKSRVLVVLIIVLFFCSGCSLLRLPLELLNSVLKIGQKLIPYYLFVFQIDEEGREDLFSRDALACALLEAREGNRNWENLASLEDCLVEMRSPGEKRILVVLPLVSRGSREESLDRAVIKVDQHVAAEVIVIIPSRHGE